MATHQRRDCWATRAHARRSSAAGNDCKADAAVAAAAAAAARPVHVGTQHAVSSHAVALPNTDNRPPPPPPPPRATDAHAGLWPGPLNSAQRSSFRDANTGADTGTHRPRHGWRPSAGRTKHALHCARNGDPLRRRSRLAQSMLTTAASHRAPNRHETLPRSERPPPEVLVCLPGPAPLGLPRKRPAFPTSTASTTAFRSIPASSNARFRSLLAPFRGFCFHSIPMPQSSIGGSTWQPRKVGRGRSKLSLALKKECRHFQPMIALVLVFVSTQSWSHLVRLFFQIRQPSCFCCGRRRRSGPASSSFFSSSKHSQ